MDLRQESVRLSSQGQELAGTLFLPTSRSPVPALVICHGAGEFKEHYFELCEYLAGRGIGTLALDLHGHGESGGERFHLEMPLWVADIRAALDWLSARPEVDHARLGAFGLSSGGTAILEAGLLDPRLKVLVALDATVRSSLAAPLSWLVRGLTWIGRIKTLLTGSGLRVPLAKLSIGPKMASSPEINRQLLADPRSVEAFLNFPLPGAEDAFFADTIERVHPLTAPTLVLWGADDTLDPPETGRRLFAALRCRKRLEIIPGNGHVGHLDRNRARVFSLTADWVLQNLPPEPERGLRRRGPRPGVEVIEGEAAQKFSREEKWERLSPFLTRYGNEPLAYATLQEGMEYFIDETGYIAYTTVQHPILSPRPRRITLSEPICAPENLPRLLDLFLTDNPGAAFGQISESFAQRLRGMGFKANCIGYEPVLQIQTYNTQGNWKELDLIKRARNEARREGITIREADLAALHNPELASFSARWVGTKRINDRELWLYARRPIFDHEEGVRKFIAYDRQGGVAGFAFYDPMYRDGQVYGYAANIVRCDERRFGRLATAIHMEAIEQFRTEGKELFNLLLAPFVKLDLGKFNDDIGSRLFFDLSAKYGNAIYNFKGLSFHKSKYRGIERPIYYASNRLMPSNDLYLAFLRADITRSYFGTLGQVLRGMIHAMFSPRAD